MLHQWSEQRYPELDALRGVAVLLMVLYHLAFDLAYFYGWDIPVYEGPWWIVARTSAATFLLLVGLCFVISWERQQATYHLQPTTSFSLYRKYLRRGLIIFSGGMLITFATWLLVPQAYVKFGILHLIGVAALLQPFFTPLKSWNVFVAAVFLVLFYLFNFYNLYNLSPLPAFLAIPLGFPSPDFSSLDYYPLVPWFGVILIGMTLGNLLYVPMCRASLQTLDRLPYPRSLLTCGRYSLWIYFVHQPLILTLLALMLGSPLFT